VLLPRFIVVSVGLLLAGCVAASHEERAAAARVQQTGAVLRPAGHQPDLPALTAESSLADYLRFALLNHPQVAAAFYDWRAAVEAITPARSLPDPQFIFQADIADTITSFMPGIMFDFMTRGKRAAMGREAAAAGEVAYRNYATTVLRTAATVRKAWIEIAYVDEALRLREASLGAIDQSAALNASDYATGRGMATLATQVLLLNSSAQVRATIAALEDRRAAARTRFKSALGLSPDAADPPWPRMALTATPLPPGPELWRAAKAFNPELASMHAMVEMAIAGVQVASKTGTPDFTLGAMIDLKADPVFVRPLANLTLPIWRDKIAATIAAAEARRDAAAARLNAEQLNLAAELAQMLYMVRESERMVSYLEGTALPNLERSLASAEAAYQSGMDGAGMIPQTRLMALGMRLERLEALRQRETAVTDLLLMIADVAPADTVLLTVAAPSSR
jgi:cobalt-zinc-cadmium efflux system outer membrane protein